MDYREAREKALVNALMQMHNVEEAHFMDDGEHIVIGPVEGALVRYRLGPVAQQWLCGELGNEAPGDGLVIDLLAPKAVA
ncbi:MAG: hypothetical protein ACRDPE_15805 [Solirubrobacterales bacterium]